VVGGGVGAGVGGGVGGGVVGGCWMIGGTGYIIAISPKFLSLVGKLPKTDDYNYGMGCPHFQTKTMRACVRGFCRAAGVSSSLAEQYAKAKDSTICSPKTWGDHRYGYTFL
jgi:hypothetical protein